MLNITREIMADHLSSERRSWNMSRIRSKNTSSERAVRSLLHKMGYRFRLHQGNLPGKPDIVLKKHNTIIFCHGCFWHQHRNCRRATIPKTNQDYWLPKLERNVTRFNDVRKQLESLGWRVAVIWECQTNYAQALRDRLALSLGGIAHAI